MLATIITPSLLFCAFLLLLLVTLSVPIIKTVYLFNLTASVSSVVEDASASVKFGVWGYCTSGVQLGGIFSDSTPAQCSKQHLGYTFDSTVASALHVDGIANVISKASTAALVLHPIACALTFITFLVSLLMLRRGSNGTARLPSLLALIIGLIAALLATIVFLIDVILVAVIRKRVKNDTHGDITLNWGNAVWMTLGAAIALWLAMLGACGGVCACGARSRNRKTERY